MEIVSPDEKPFTWVNEQGSSAIVLVCEHASNIIPKALSNLGLTDEDLERHIAYDIGAAGVAHHLSALLDAPLLLQNFSRLIYDCNRSPEMPGAMPQRSEVYDIPGNQNLSPAQHLARTNQIYRPFHHALEQHLDKRAATRKLTALISIHSFTRNYHGVRRTVDVGLLFDRDDRLLIDFEPEFTGFQTLHNQPYGPKDGVMHLMNLHASPRGLHHLMIEIGNDLITTQENQKAWGERLGHRLQNAANRLGE